MNMLSCTKMAHLQICARAKCMCTGVRGAGHTLLSCLQKQQQNSIDVVQLHAGQTGSFLTMAPEVMLGRCCC